MDESSMMLHYSSESMKIDIFLKSLMNIDGKFHKITDFSSIFISDFRKISIFIDFDE
jgi:hypothetical protein